MKKKKGFTLIELIGVIIVIALIAMLAFPAIIKVINNSRHTLHDEQIAELKKSARNWYVTNVGVLTKEQNSCVSITELVQTGYIDKTEVSDPTSDEPFDGYIMINYNASYDKYEYEYSDTCDIDMSGFRLRLMNTSINSNGYAKTNVNVAVLGGKDTTSYRYCISTTSECEPTIDVSKVNDTIVLKNEVETNYACAYGLQKDGSKTDTICMGPYKIDKTSPTLTIDEDLTFKTTDTNINLYQGIEYHDNMTPDNKLNIRTSGVVSKGVVGDYIINYTVSDLAGNSITKSRTIYIIMEDNESPNITLKVEGKPFNNNKWASKNFNVLINAEDGAGSGIASYTYCVANNRCTPGNKVNAQSGKAQMTDEGTNNYVCALATDKAGNTSDTVCVGPYKLDKTNPLLTIPSNITIPVTARGTNLDEGVSYSDNYTETSNITYTKEGNLTEGIFGTYTVKYTVVDMAGNKTTKSRTITVGDTEAPSFTISTSGSFNTNGWANKNFEIKINANDGAGIGVDKITYCLGNNCEPSIDIKGKSGSVSISNESNAIYLCAKVTDLAGNVSEKKCAGPYKLDKSAPTVNSFNTIVIDEKDTLNIWDGITYQDNYTSTSNIAKSAKGEVSNVIPGVYVVTFTLKDQADNTKKFTRTIKVRDTEPPTLTITNNGTFNANGWAKTAFKYILEADDGIGLGVEKITYCTTTTSTTCTPTNDINSDYGEVNAPEGKAIYLCATAEDITGNINTKQCTGPHKLDTHSPTTNTITDLTIVQYDDLDLWSGITYSDNLTATANITNNVTSTATNQTAGTYTASYSLTDEAGNEKTFTRNIIVKALYTIKVNAYTNWGVTFSYNITRSDTNTTLSNQTSNFNQNIVVGNTIKVVANSKTGYTFQGWYDSSNNLLSSNATYEFTVNNSVTIHPEYLKTASITFGTATVNGNTVTIPYTYTGDGTLSLINGNTTATSATVNTTTKIITINANEMGQSKITLSANKTSNYTAASNYKTITIGDIASDSNSTAFQEALTKWGKIGPSTDANWYGTTTNGYQSSGEYVIIETVNTENYTGYYFTEKQDDGSYIAPKYKDIVVDVDMTSTSSDDDTMGIMIRFNPEATTNYWSGYMLFLDKHDMNSGVGNGYNNGLIRANNIEFSLSGTIPWASSGGNGVRLVINRDIVWARNKWEHYRVQAIGNKLTVYRWDTNSSGDYITSDGAKIFEYTDTSSDAISEGTYGFWCISQDQAQYKNLTAITSNGNYQITVS